MVCELHHDLLEHGLQLFSTESDPYRLALFVRNLRLFKDLATAVSRKGYDPTLDVEKLVARIRAFSLKHSNEMGAELSL